MVQRPCSGCSCVLINSKGDRKAAACDALSGDGQETGIVASKVQLLLVSSDMQAVHRSNRERSQCSAVCTWQIQTGR
jgi:hypothetical protein